jgi:Transposase IS116/IS110/IS902 family
MMIAAIGNIANFEHAAALKSYFGWAPRVSQSGKTFDHASLTQGGIRTMKQAMFLVVANAVRLDTEWAKLYQCLVPLKCSYDERTRTYRAKIRVFGRIAGQIISMLTDLCPAETRSGSAKPGPARWKATGTDYPLVFSSRHTSCNQRTRQHDTTEFFAV